MIHTSTTFDGYPVRVTFGALRVPVEIDLGGGWRPIAVSVRTLTPSQASTWLGEAQLFDSHELARLAHAARRHSLPGDVRRVAARPVRRRCAACRYGVAGWEPCARHAGGAQ